MMPLTMYDIAEFLQMTLTAFSDPLFFMLVSMVTFAVLYHVKDLIVSGLR